MDQIVPESLPKFVIEVAIGPQGFETALNRAAESGYTLHSWTQTPVRAGYEIYMGYTIVLVKH